MPIDTQDLLFRLKATLPTRWFEGDTPILDGVLTGLASAWSSLHIFLNFTRNQTRISSATGDFLDAISHDFLGSMLPRRAVEPDNTYRHRLALELVRERDTRTALQSVLIDLTGRPPIVFEPSRPADTGAWNITGGYTASGGWGSLALPYQCFVTAYRATGSGIADIAGYGVNAGGYGQGRLEYAGLDMITGEITDADITRAIANIMPVSTIAWTRISD
jgi:hypothetical protein